MASKLHEGNSVAERRLRPIYEFMESGNSKKALQEADKVLKKQPDFQCAKVLKALALLRLGRENECEKILEGVMAENPVDDTILQAMTVCFRDLQKPEMICQIYDRAVIIDPNSEELLSHLFMSYVRIGDYQKQKQTALALYKLRPKNPYYFWAVMSIVMQAHAAESQATKGIVLTVAERMISNFIKEGKIETEQEVQLYLMVLEMQGKYKEALDVLNGPLGKKLDPHLVTTVKRTDLMIKLGLWKEVNLYLKEQLLDEIDAWSNYLHYFSSVLHIVNLSNLKPQTNSLEESAKLIKNGICEQTELNCKDTALEDKCEDVINGMKQLLGTSKTICDNSSENEQASAKDKCYLNGSCEDDALTVNDETAKNCVSKSSGDSKTDSKNLTIDDSLNSCVKFLSRLQAENERLKHPLRGPYLAPLELYLRLVEKKIDPEPLLGDLVSLLMAYYKQFGSKQCCLSDIQTYLVLLNHDQINQLLQQIQAFVGLSDNEAPSEVVQMQRHISSLQISRVLGLQDSPDFDKMEYTLSLWKLYLAGDKFNTGVLETNLGLNDTYALLAAHVLHDLWYQENSYVCLIYAIAILEYALAKSPANYLFKLLLLKFYNILGATKAASKQWQLLDVKHMQLVSLGYLIQDPLLKCGHFQNAYLFYECALKFFQSNLKDNSDFMIISYKFGSFLKIGEFLEFRDKLNNSIQHYFVKVEQSLLEIFTSVNFPIAVKKVPQDCLTIDCDSLEKLEDNRNDNVFNMCNPSNRRSTPELLGQTFNHEVSLLKLRIYTLRSIAAATDVTKRNSTALETVISTRKSIETLINKLKEDKQSIFKENILTGISKSRLFMFLDSPYYFPYLCQLLKIVEKLGEQDLDAVLAEIESAVSILNASVKNCADNVANNLNSMLQEREIVTTVIEMFCLSAVFSSIITSLAKNEKTSAPKQSKKKNKKDITSGGDQRVNLSNRKATCDTIYVAGVLKAGKELEEILSKVAEPWSTVPDFDFSGFIKASSDIAWSEEDFAKAIDCVCVNLQSSYKSSIFESSNLLCQKLKLISELNS